MNTLLLLFTGFILGVGFTILGVCVYNDYKEDEKRTEESNNRIKQLTERLQNEKNKFYNNV